MKKFLRRFAIFMGVLGVALLAAGFILRNRAHEVPAWYRHVALDAKSQHLAAREMDNKLLVTYGAANDAMAAAARAKYSVPPDRAVDLPPTPITLDLTESEMNAFFGDWDNLVQWRNRISKYVIDPVIILEDNELILAATITDWNMVVSLHFEPKLENGKLYVGLKRAMVGTLELPRATVDHYTKQLEANIRENLPQFRERAEISPKGWANGDAVAAATGELLLHALHDEPAEPVLMIREIGRGGPEVRYIPVEITAINIASKNLSLHLRTMTADEREALEQHLQGKDSPVALQAAMKSQ